MEKARGDADFINSDVYVRYHIGARHCQMIGHKKGGYKIGGLWTMGFNPEILDDFFWQRITNEAIYNLDGEISMFVQHEKIDSVWFNDHNGVGIKGHGYGKFKQTGPHKALNIPYITDPELARLMILTDESFMQAHGLPWKRYQKTNKELRADLKTIFNGLPA